MTIHIHIKTDIIRDASDVTKTINVVLEKHSDSSEINGTYTNQDGDEISNTYHGYVDDTITDTRSMVFTIPDDQQTNLIVGTSTIKDLNLEWCFRMPHPDALDITIDNIKIVIW